MKKYAFAVIVLFGFSLGLAQEGFAEDKITTGVVDYQSGGIVFDPENIADPAVKLPTNLNFGSHVIQSIDDETWGATVDGVQTSALTTGRVAVSDNRGGTGTGWTVKVVQPTQFVSGTSELTGAVLSIYGGAITNNLNSTPSASIANSTLQLALGTTADVVTAAPDEGAGETSLSLDKFELFVPKTVNKKQTNYQTTLTWTFSATP